MTFQRCHDAPPADPIVLDGMTDLPRLNLSDRNAKAQPERESRVGWRYLAGHALTITSAALEAWWRVCSMPRHQISKPKGIPLD